MNQIYSNFVMEIYIGMLKDVWNILQKDDDPLINDSYFQFGLVTALESILYRKRAVRLPK